MARNGILFLMAWEIMSLASFFLVTFEDEREDVRRAGWTYLVATHIGTGIPVGTVRATRARVGLPGL